MPLSPGARLGAYEIVATIGAGGMGEVFRARDGRLGRDVALKLLPEGVTTDPERRARFDREARTLAALNHPGIVTIFAVEEAAERHFIAMEYVEGRPLSEAIPKAGLPVDRLLTIAAQVASAVAAAHRHGIVHRDLKPANVMVGAHDRVKVLDFGLAKLREETAFDAETLLPSRELTGEGRIVGTVSYMSPEQAEGRKVDERSDVFSLGVLLYEMGTAERPFKGETSLSVLSAILRETPRPISEIKPSLPRDLARIVRRCLAKDPDERYQSAADLRNDLEDLRQSVASGQLERPVYLSAPARSRRWGAAAAGLAIVAAVAGLAWMAGRAPAAGTAPPAPDMTFNRLTLLGGVSQEPMISPDGKWAVYVNGASGNADIYLQSTTGQTAINLTKDSKANDTAPALSPNGELIVFRSERDGGGLFVMGRTGESVRRLTRQGYQPAWFPDGKTIIFATALVTAPEGRGGATSELWTVDTAGGEPRRLSVGDAVNPSVSPRGRRIAYWSLPTDPARTRFESANRDIWTMAADGSNPVRVTSHPATDWNPVWSPDGRWLYFLSNRSGSMNLWRIAIDEATGVTSGQAQAMTAPASYIRNFSLSADGRLGAFASLETTNNVARVPFDPQTATPRGPVQSLTTGPRDFSSIDVSPDGQLLLITTSSRVQEDLFLLPADGGGLRNLTSDLFRDRNPQWSPDGRRIIFYSDRNRNYDLWSIDRDGGGMRQLTETGGRRYFPVPSPDGRKLVAADIGTGELFQYDLGDTARAPEKLPPVPQEVRAGPVLTPTSWSPDGTKFLGHGGVGAPLFLYDTLSKTYRILGTFAGGGSPQWLPDGVRIVFTRQGRVVVMDTVKGDSREVFSIDGENVTAPHPSPDGRFLYFLRGTQSGDIWVVRFGEGQGEGEP